MKNSKKGFTLAELLVVVAIIAVLVAIAIPVFSAQQEKARDAVSVANMRAAYAEAMTDYLTASSATDEIDKTVVIKSEDDNEWSGVAADLPFDAPDDPGAAGTYTMTFTFDDGVIDEVTLTAATSSN